MLIDTRNRRYPLTLDPDDVFHSHIGLIPHAELIGMADGSVAQTSLGRPMVVLRPTLADFIFSMTRGAQVIYPKDIGPILMYADLFPGARVFEAGVGSGALSMALLRAVGPTGSVLAYEIREDFANRARNNIESFLGPGQPMQIELRNAYDGIDAVGLDRVILDLPEPWMVVPHTETAMRSGGILLAYLPTVTQLVELHRSLERSKFAMVQTIEVLERPWHLDGRSVRPEHRMVGHTGFLTTARLLSEHVEVRSPRRNG